jgi:glycosyltransferase involved in cell wall biosynthesis
VLCLSRPGDERFERDGRLTVRRLPLRRIRGGAVSYLAEYAAFLLVAMVVVAFLHARRRYDVVQVHSLPDTLVFAALVPKLTGAKVVLDLHEVMPEFVGTKFGRGVDSPLVKLVGFAEQASIRFADVVFTCTNEMRDAFVARGARKQIGVILNSADEAIFDPSAHPPQPRRPGHFTLISHGSIEDRYGVDTAIEAVALLRDEIPELRLRVFGDGTQRDELVARVRQLGLEDRVIFSDGWAPIEDLLDAIADADAGIVAMKRDAFRDLTHCNKMYDLISMRRPALVSRTYSVERYFGDGSFLMFESDNAPDLADAIRRLYREPQLGEELVERAAATAEPYRWPNQKREYLEMLAPVLKRRALPAAR